ncbi:YqgE/AlgH family protein [Neolewinella lacunae]|uniref:YqgE/AlgH family protein n=1 Tax=Neolewinella lacunae TaxID=1517758 RepID=A0A923PPK8_9BACT|nr:YqgE/AlgH family protein [Neolewinella lacunae]MBC6996230.1 YqgE/AlgH family protein [Neolewinella lacunae]MDN3634750.1 YqgE/AlgH family protein [Neolewinella lacunae]
MNKAPKTGTLLLAEPFMLDPNFKRSAVLLVEHGSEGSIGFVLNRQTEIRVDELIEDFPEIEANIYYGGPVGTDTIHYLHCKRDLLEGSDEVCPGVFWGGDFERLKFFIRQQLILPQDIRFFLGYSGWSEDQLKEELQSGSWVTAPMFANYLFKSQPENLWSQVMENKGSAFSVIAQMDEEAHYN